MTGAVYENACINSEMVGVEWKEGKRKTQKIPILLLGKFPDIFDDQSCLRPTVLDLAGWDDRYNLSPSLMKTCVLASLGTGESFSNNPNCL